MPLNPAMEAPGRLEAVRESDRRAKRPMNMEKPCVQLQKFLGRKK